MTTSVMHEQLDQLLNAVLSLRDGVRRLDELGIQDAAALVDQALSMIEPLHPEVVAGLHGQRPFPEELRPFLEGLERDTD